MLLEDYITITEASELLSVHPETVKRLCRQGQIKASKLGNNWLINKQVLKDFAKDYDSTVGRPKRS